jgi:arylsulfatase A
MHPTITRNHTQGHIGLSLFDLESDAGETKDVKQANPDIVEKMEKLADEMRRELGDSAKKIKGEGVRPFGRL